jgi:hypothetical protein
MLEELLPTEELEIGILDPAITQRLIAQSYMCLGSAKPAIRPRHIASWLYAKKTASYRVERFPLKPLTLKEG